LFMTVKVIGTMNSGKGDTGSMNTTRQAEYFMFAMNRANIPSSAYQLLVAGDDVLIGLSARYRAQFEV